MTHATNSTGQAASHKIGGPGQTRSDQSRASSLSFAGLYHWLHRQRRRRTAVRDLNALSDRLLRDIGLARHEIPAFVGNRLALQADQPEPPLLVRRAGRAVCAGWRQLLVWYLAQDSARQLRFLNDRQLADIGLDPSDIDWVAQDLAERAQGTPDPANENRPRIAA